MLKVALENVKRLLNFIKKPTSEYGAGARSLCIGYDMFLMPINNISVSAMSTGEDYSIRAVISTQPSIKAKAVDGKVGGFLPLTPTIMTFLYPLSLPEGYKEKRVNLNTIKITDKDSVTQYAIHIYEEGYPAIISAGEEAVPSGVTKRLTTQEEFEKDIGLFAQILESFVNNIYTVGVFMAEAMVDSEKNEKNKKFVEEFKEIANTNQFLYIRAPMFSDEKLEDEEFGDNKPPDMPPPPQIILHQELPNRVGKVHKFFKPEDIDVGLEDVAGLDSIKEEVTEMMDFVKNPSKYDALGAEVSRTTLFKGPPGCGKTMFAKAIAKEAGLNFISMEGSAFVEVFVGVAAGRVRAMYEDAEKNQPCIVFIDEIDSFAKIRNSAGGGGGEEREQGLNQLLTEMDGFKKSRNIFTVAATNRPDMLDPAILDRFANQITIPLPDIQARAAILASHARKKVVSLNMDWNKVAISISGFSGRDIKNLLNQAALLAIKRNKKCVEEIDVLDSRDKVIWGAEHRIKNRLPEELRATAYHESGHAVITALYRGILDPLYKVTIIPHGFSLGLTASIPKEDKYRLTKEEILTRVRMYLGGRAAEIILYDGHSNRNRKVSTGASEDIKNATQLLYDMVTEDGLSDEIGPICYKNGAKHQNLGYFIPGEIIISEKMREKIDMTVRNIMIMMCNKAEKTLREHWSAVIALANLLLEKEIATGEEVMRIIKDKPPLNEENHASPVVKTPIKIVC